MPKVKQLPSSASRRKTRPALTPEARENQLIAKAYDLVERRIEEGTASSQETTHFLKMGSMKARLELEKLREENDLLRAKTKAIQNQEVIEELYKNAIEAMRRYSGHYEDDIIDAEGEWIDD